METQTLETTTQPVATETPAVPVPVPVEGGEGEKPDVAVVVDGLEVAVTDTEGGLELTPATGFVAVLVLGLLAVAVVKLRKK